MHSMCDVTMNLSPVIVCKPKLTFLIQTCAHTCQAVNFRPVQGSISDMLMFETAVCSAVHWTCLRWMSYCCPTTTICWHCHMSLNVPGLKVSYMLLSQLFTSAGMSCHLLLIGLSWIFLLLFCSTVLIVGL